MLLFYHDAEHCDGCGDQAITLQTCMTLCYGIVSRDHVYRNTTAMERQEDIEKLYFTERLWKLL